MTTTTTDCAVQTDPSDPLHLPMPRRALGSTGWEAGLLTMGGVKWEMRLDEVRAIELLHRAMELGVNSFDTAAGYGRGESERRLGKAIAGRRDQLWIQSKNGRRSYDEARRGIDESLERLGIDTIDCYMIHAVGDDDDYARITESNSVLRALDEYRKAGHIRFIGVSGHHYKHNMLRAVRELELDAVLLPNGLFNEAYGYSYLDDVAIAARDKGMAVMGMKVFGAGRVMAAHSIEPYLRFAMHTPVDTMVIGCDGIEQLEATVRVIKRQPAPLPADEAEALYDEARQVTQRFDDGEFNWVEHYRQGKP